MAKCISLRNLFLRPYFNKWKKLNDKVNVKRSKDEMFKKLIKFPLLKLSKIPLLVYANKADLNTCLGIDEIVDKLELNDITDRDWSLFACSALKGFGIMEGLKWLIEKFASKK